MSPADLALWAPLVPQVLVGLAAVVLCLDGARATKVAVAVAAFGSGAVGAAVLASGALGLDGLTTAVLSLCGGVGALLLARIAEKVGLVVVGSVLGAALVGGVDQTFGLGLPWWASLAGVVLGGLLMPRAFGWLLIVLTPAVGGGLLAWAVGRQDDLRIIGAAFVVGVVVQLGRRGRRDDEDGG